MLLLLFHAGENLYAIDTDQVIEIVPMVLLRKVQPAPDYLAGVFNYRGSIVPVIDLCRLITGKSCQVCYSTRIILMNRSGMNGSMNGGMNGSMDHSGVNSEVESATDHPSRQCPIGLVAERVTETLKISAAQLEAAANSTEQIISSPHLGELLIDEKGLIQKVNWEHLITDVQQTQLWTEGNGQTNGAGYY